MSLTQELLKELFTYKDGRLYRAKPIGRNFKVGTIVGYLMSYKCGVARYIVGIEGKYYLNSRLIFLLHRGYLPDIVDHINRDTTDDNITNLRAATSAQNNKNRSARKNKKGKYLGVCPYNDSGKWMAQGTVPGKGNKFIGSFETEKEAALAYNTHAFLYYGEFANLNIIEDQTSSLTTTG